MHPAAATPVIEPGARIADFVVERLLGQGGSFVLAKSPERLRSEGDHVVLKVFAADTASDEPTAMHSVSAALRSVAAVQSPYLVRLLETGRNAGTFYCAMQYLPGGSLVAPHAQLTFAEVLRAVACAARGAHALHEAGIAHRNIHPSGVILDEDGAKLTDPGLAGYLNPGMTITGRLGVPTVDFIAPDIIRGQGASRDTDVWSLGATLHFVASGQSLFPALDRSNPVLALSTVLNTPPTVADGLPGPIDAIVRQCIDPASPDRPATADELANRLDDLWKR